MKIKNTSVVLIIYCSTINLFALYISGYVSENKHRLNMFEIKITLPWILKRGRPRLQQVESLCYLGY